MAAASVGLRLVDKSFGLRTNAVGPRQSQDRQGRAADLVGAGRLAVDWVLRRPSQGLFCGREVAI